MTHMKDDLTIDIVIPTYRRSALLLRCLSAMMTQECPLARVVVVARADDDVSQEAARGFEGRIPGLLLVTVVEPGMIAALSAGVAATTSPIVAFTDDDAAPRPDWARRLLAHFADPTVGAVGGRDIVRGDEAPLTEDVGVFRRTGRLIGNHHLGTGPARDAHVLKGVNMAFRAEALAMPAVGVLRGRGTQMNSEILCCAFARSRGWRVIYDPAIVVDHEGAPRAGPDQRRRPPLSAVFDAAYNSVVASCALERHAIVPRVGFSLLVGRSDGPGAARALLGVVRRETEVMRRAVPAILGGLWAVGALLRRPGGGNPYLLVPATDLRGGRRRRPRIALVAHDVHDHGGMERACAELIRHTHDDIAFTVVAAHLEPDLLPLVERWVPIRIPERPFPLKFISFWARAGLTLNRVEVDLVHTVGANVPNRADVVSVYHCHAGQRNAVGRFTFPSLPPLRRLNTAISRRIALLAERHSYSPTRVRLFLTSTETLSRELHRCYPGVATAVVPNGVTHLRPTEAPERLREVTRSRMGVGENTVVALFLGGDWHRKGLPAVIDAFSLLGDSIDIRLWVVGRGSRTDVERLKSHPGLETRVQVVGEVPDVMPFYAGADIFVLASSYETFSIPCFEAAVNGLPIIVTNVHGAREIVTDGQGGVLVEPAPQAIASALGQLANNQKARRDMGKRAQRYAASFTWDRAAHLILKAYYQLLADRIPSSAHT